MSNRTQSRFGCARVRRAGRVWALAALVALVGARAAFSAAPRPGAPMEIQGEAMTLSFSYHYFDGAAIDTVVLTARTLQLVTDTLGAWTPVGDGTTSDGFLLKHRKRDNVRLALRPFTGPGPGRNDDDWRNYRWAVAARLGAETQIQDLGKSGTAGGVPSFGSWEAREAWFETPQPDGSSRAERHFVANDGKRGIAIIMSGPTADVTAIDQDLRFFVARLERQEPNRTARND